MDIDTYIQASKVGNDRGGYNCRSGWMDNWYNS